LIVHFNGGSIADVGAQIDHFRKGYKVIAMDSRDHGKSGDSPDKLTYEKMIDDLAALLDHLQTGPVDVLGWWLSRSFDAVGKMNVGPAPTVSRPPRSERGSANARTVSPNPAVRSFCPL
jgi:hypothetical protein